MISRWISRIIFSSSSSSDGNFSRHRTVTEHTPFDIGSILAHVKKPSRYIGNEFNGSCKSWDAAGLKVALAFPDLYEIGMSHHGLHVLYGALNRQEGVLADRVYAPDKDLEELLQKRGIPLFGVESRRSLAAFDMVGITLPYELCYTNILTILALGQIPFRSAARGAGDPFIVGGGSGSFNPEPVADFFDAILLGDGEEAVLEIGAAIQRTRKIGLARPQALAALGAIPGVYVPALFQPRYDSGGKLLAVEPLQKGYEKVARRILPDLELTPANEKPLVPLVKIIHDRLGIEVARGCTRGCRFCQAGTVYRPVRERSPGKILQLAEKGVGGGGFEELALLSLSTGDYSCLSSVLGRLMDRFVQDYVSISMPSMRVGTLTPEIMQQIKRVRKTGFTLAPEAGTDRLRRVINKGITEEDLLQTCRDAGTLGWKLLKFYFMLGLPSETDDDVRGIAELVRRAGATSRERRLRINISAAAFVPKPHTPFQWEPQISIKETFAKIDLLKKSLPRGNYRLKWHDPQQSFLEGVMSRGDRRLAGVIEEAWRRGARLDAWSEHFNLATWEAAARAVNIDLTRYLRRRDLSEVLPWDHLDTGVSREFLRAELEKSRTGIYTPDCRVHSCQQCGVCDFKTVQPVVQKAGPPEDERQATEPVHLSAADREERKAAGRSGQQDGTDHWYRVFYAKQGDIRFLSHLEMIQVFFQALRRAGIRLHFSQGFNPVPKASFCPALPVGTESLAEYLDIDLIEPVADEGEFIRRLNDQLPRGIRVLTLAGIPAMKSRTPPKNLSCYTVSLVRHLTSGERKALAAFLAQDTFAVTRTRKGRQKVLDIRKQVRSLVLRDEKSLEMHLLTQEGTATAKPLEILQAVFGFSESECLDLGILKVWSRVVE